jgi:hypothetical protein
MAPRRLIVNWQDEASRSILPVGELIERSADAGGATSFEFGYLEGVRGALKKGFQPFASFPELARRYESSSLFPFFQNRVLPTTRPDYPSYVEALGLRGKSVSVVELLGRSEGRRQTDCVETVLAARPNPETGGYLTHFLVRAVRHIPGAEDAAAKLRVGDVLSIRIDHTNPVNARARLLSDRGADVGFVPDYLLEDMEALDRQALAATFTVERVNPSPHPPQHRLLVRVDAPWPLGFEPFRDGPFAPYRLDDAAQLAV